MTFGDVLKSLRGYESQASFARRMGVLPNRVCRFESGQARPRVGFVVHLCRQFPDRRDDILESLADEKYEDGALDITEHTLAAAS